MKADTVPCCREQRAPCSQTESQQKQTAVIHFIRNNGTQENKAENEWQLSAQPETGRPYLLRLKGHAHEGVESKNLKRGKGSGNVIF